MSQQSSPLLWITDLKGGLLREISIDESGRGFSMGCLRNYLYFALNNLSRGSILKTGLLGAPIKLIDLGQENQDSIAFNIYVAPELLDAIKEFSPLKFQKGF